MADPSLLFDEPKKEEPRGSLLKSTALAVGEGALKDIVAPVGEAVAAATGDDSDSNVWRRGAGLARKTAAAVDETIPADRRADRDAEFFPGPGKQSVFKNPLSSLAMKGASALPIMAGFAATEGVGGATLLGAGQAVAQRVSDVHGELEAMTDPELETKFQNYREYIEWGFSPKDARKMLADDLLNGRSLTAAALSGAAGGGGLGAAFHGAAGRGVMRTALDGVMHGAVGGAGMGAAGEVASQAGGIEAGGREGYSSGDIARAAGNAAAEMGVLGGAMAGVGGARRSLGKSASTWADRRLADKAKRDVVDLPTEGNAPSPEVEAVAKTENNKPNAVDDGPSALDKQIAEATKEIEKAESVATAPEAKAPEVKVPEVKEPAQVTPEAPAKIEPHETVEQIEAKLGSPEPVAEPAREPSNVPGEQPSEAAKSLPTDLPIAAEVEAPATPDTTIKPHETVEQVEAKLAPTTETPAEIVPVPEAPIAEMPIAPVKGKLTVKKPVTELRKKVATATGVTPEGSTAVKVERAVKKRQVFDAKAAREKAAENARLRAEGKPVVLKGNGSIEGAETPEARETRIAQEAKGALNEKDKQRKREARLRANGANDAKAKEVLEDLWKDERGKVDEEALSDTEAKALGGDPEARAEIMSRAKRVVIVAQNSGVERKRASHSKLAPDERNLTPWASFVHMAGRLAEKYEKTKPNTPARDVHGVPIKGKTVHDEIIQQYVAAEQAMRKGDVDAAHADRIMRNDELTAKKTDASVTKEGGDNFDANSKDAATRTNEVEEATHAAIDAKNYRDPNSSTGGNSVVPVFDADKLLKKATTEYAAHSLKGVLDNVTPSWYPPDRSGLQTAQRVIGIRKEVTRLVGDATVHVIPDDVFDEHSAGAAAAYAPTDEAFARGKKTIIVVRESHARDPVVILHEAIHAATSNALYSDKVLRRDVKTIMDDILSHNPDLAHEYGFTDEHEFIAEAMANPEFQAELQAVTVSPRIATRWGKVRNLWDKFVTVVAKALGVNRYKVNALEVAMKIGGDAMFTQEFMRTVAKEMNGARYDTRVNAAPVRDKVKNYWDEHRPSADNWKLRKQRFLDKLATTIQLANTSDHLFGPDQHARTLAELMGRMATEKDTILRERAEPLINDLNKAQRKYDQIDANGKSLWQEFSDLLHDETTAGVDASKPLEVKKDKKGNVKAEKPGTWYGRAMHPELSARYDALVKKAPELAALRERMHDYFRDTQNKQSLGLINNALNALSPDGKGSPALAQRIFEGKTTEADKKVLGGDGALKAILEANKLSQISGPYIPLMRRGDIVVQGRHEIATPAGAKRFSADDGTPLQITPKGNIFEFNTRDEAERFVKGTLADKGLRPERVQRVNVDPKTGSKFGFDEDGKRRRLTKEETNTDEKWRVTVNDSHVEFHETVEEAKRAKNELVKSGLQDVAHLDLKRTDAQEVNNKFLPQQIQNMLNAIEKRNSFKELGKDAQHALRRQLIEAGIASMGTTRAQTKRLPRRNVRGYSTELTKNAQQYASSAAGYLARLKHQPKIDATLKAMNKFADEQRYADANSDTLQIERRQRLKEFERRVYDNAQPNPQGLFHDVTGRLLQMSFLDKLASPAFHIINSGEPWTIAMPVIAGRHGAFKTIAALKNAYGTVGGGRMLGAGFKDTVKAFKDHADLTDYLKTMQDRVKGQPDGNDLRKVLQHLTDIGLLSRDAGLELARVADPSSNMLGRALDRTDLMARQLGAAIESINRSVTAVAAYRLERAKGKDHEQALRYATEVVHDSMGDYSSWNASPMFKSPVGRLALQFKKYPQRMYYLLGKQAAAAFRGNPEAMKGFAGLMATHMLIAGALGLPTEPIKLAMLAAGFAGLTDKKYEDLERGVRSGAANVFGKAGGEIFTRGLPRWLGFDLASRAGLNTLATSGIDPKSMKKDDLWAWFAQNFAGAPASLLMDGVQGFQALSQGDVLEASRLLVPLKVYADSVQAYQMATVGKQTSAGKQLMNPIRLDQAMVKAMGFQPGAVAEQTEQAFAIRDQQHDFATKRQNMINHWLQATPGEKTAQYKLINEWNQTQPQNARITMSELTRAMQRRQTDTAKQDYSKPGIRTTKRDQHLPSQNDFYNANP